MSYGSRAYGWPAGYGQAYGGVGSQNVASSTSVLVTPTTTRALIRDSVASAIEALSPSRLASKLFRYSQHEGPDFRVWADDNDSAVFREFAIEFDDWEPFGVSDGLVQRRSSTMSVVVAYPHHWATYQSEGVGRRGMEDIIERDLSLIAYTAGIHGSGNYPSGSCPRLDQSVTVELGDGVSFGVLEVEIEWYAKLGV